MTERILIVDDDATMRDVVSTYLGDEKGYDCTAAEDGRRAVALLEAEAFDLLLTDLKMPGMDGLALVARANEICPDVPKVILSGHSEFEATLQALRLGAYDFIRKPMPTLEELGLVAARALERRRLALQNRAHQREIERMNAALEDEVRRRTEDLIRANRELRTLDEMKNNLLANVSHELRTPLVSVRGYTELFASGQLCDIPEECRTYLHTCLRNIDKLLTLIESLVHYADLAREGADLALSDADLATLLREWLDETRARAEDAEVTLRDELPDEPIRVRLDRARMAEAVGQILDNAVKFNRPGGSVRLEIAPVAKRLVKVLIHDTGIGIPESEQARIFERFYQVDAAPTRRHGGTGMGLAIARDNLRLMGCELRVSSRNGEGSTFYFTMPTAEPLDALASAQP